MQLYTKRGDYGNTNLIGGKTVRKDDDRVEAYGTIDELNSIVGYAINQLPEGNTELKNELFAIQHYLFDSGTDLADHTKKLEAKITEEEIKWLEEKIDEHSEKAAPLEKFILPGGHPSASLFQIARTVTRRAERCIVPLVKEEEENKDVFIFINRLSDYFFAVARELNAECGIEEPTYDRGGKVFHEIKKPK